MEQKTLKFARSAMVTILLACTIGFTQGCNDSSETLQGIEDDLPGISGYPIVGTNQHTWYDNYREVDAPAAGDAFYGQNAQYPGTLPSYQDNGNGTITDLVTGLMWTQSCDMNGDGVIDYSDKMSQSEATAGAKSFDLAGYDDWRLPNIKEQYSLIIFSGIDPSGYQGTATENMAPFIDTDYFEFGYGDANAGERIIDAQFATTSLYVSTTMMGAETMFGVNLADGRIKGYPTGPMPGKSESKQFYVLYVRGNADYGINRFADNDDGTITDDATKLMWMKDDDGKGLTWQDALSYAENAEYAGHTDWRLPDAKELQSIVDYSRSPSTTSSAAIDPLFNCTEITNEAGQSDYGCYWSSTTHASWTSDAPGANAVYVCFGRAMGYMHDWIDVHGAGAQRSDPKVGNPDEFPAGRGPQGDAIRIYNYVRLVRHAD